MKKKLLIVAAASLVAVSHLAAAAQTIQLDEKLKTAHKWTSMNSRDVVTVESAYYDPIIEIRVDSPSYGTRVTGINIQNCIGKTHAEANSLTQCKLDDKKKPLTFASDSPEMVSGGTVEIIKG